jgi:hypothetical protein
MRTAASPRKGVARHGILITSIDFMMFVKANLPAPTRSFGAFADEGTWAVSKTRRTEGTPYDVR